MSDSVAYGTEPRLFPGYEVINKCSIYKLITCIITHYASLLIFNVNRLVDPSKSNKNKIHKMNGLA